MSEASERSGKVKRESKGERGVETTVVLEVRLKAVGLTVVVRWTTRQGPGELDRKHDDSLCPRLSYTTSVTAASAERSFSTNIL